MRLVKLFISFSYKLTIALTVDNTGPTLLLFNCEQSQLSLFYLACYVVRTFFNTLFLLKIILESLLVIESGVFMSQEEEIAVVAALLLFQQFIFLLLSYLI